MARTPLATPGPGKKELELADETKILVRLGSLRAALRVLVLSPALTSAAMRLRRPGTNDT